MDYSWYFQGVGGGVVVTDTTLSETETIEVTDTQNSINWKTSRLLPTELAYEVHAYKVEGDDKEEIEVSTTSTVSESTTYINILWKTPFNGIVEITTWQKSI